MIILLKSIEHFIFQSAEEGFHHAIVIAVTLSGHGLNDSVLCVIRKNENGKDAFGKKAENACAVTLINRSAREVVVYLTSADVSGAQTLVSDDGQIFTARSGAFSVKIKGLQGMTMFAM